MLSNCEKQFLIEAVKDKRRIDGREWSDYRSMRIEFGVDRGCCLFQIGNTRVRAQVSCQLVIPKSGRPSEGLLFINVDILSDFGRPSDDAVLLGRLLESCIKQSRCVDLEALCITTGEKTWEIRLDITVQNNDGNATDACCIAAIAALSHFRHPDVTVSNGEIVIHPLDSREPVPLGISHFPICVTFVFFMDGKYMLLDPNLKEESVSNGKLAIAVNKHREVYTVSSLENTLLLKDQLLRCANIAVTKAVALTDFIKDALEKDNSARRAGQKVGCSVSLDMKKMTVISLKSSESIEVKTVVITSSQEDDNEDIKDDSSDAESSSSSIEVLGKATVRLSSKRTEISSCQSDNKRKLVTTTSKLKGESKQRRENIEETIVMEDSEEEETYTLQPDDINWKRKPLDAPQTQKKLDLTQALKSKRKNAE